jgi:hypothetical protein
LKVPYAKGLLSDNNSVRRTVSDAVNKTGRRYVPGGKTSVALEVYLYTNGYSLTSAKPELAVRHNPFVFHCGLRSVDQGKNRVDISIDKAQPVDRFIHGLESKLADQSSARYSFDDLARMLELTSMIPSR